jgi:hypothetical protein
VGLAAIRELADELDVDVRLGEGTCLWARKFAASVGRRRQIGIMGRAHPVERVSGDHAAFVRTPDDLVFAIADGLGHGPLAREASGAAIRAFLTGPRRDEAAILEACHVALAPTRGAVMAVGRIGGPAQEVSVASVGNVTTYVCGPRAARRIGGASWVLGARGPRRPAHVERVALGPRDVVLAFTDGITSRATLEGDLDVLLEHPVVIAQRVLERFARADDDVLVMAMR